MTTHKIEDISKSEYHNKPISIRCVVAGKSVSPYRIPRKVKITPVLKDGILGNPKTYIIKTKNDDILRFIDMPKMAMKNVIRDILNIPIKIFELVMLDTQTVDRIFYHAIAGENQSRAQQTSMGYVINNSLDINCLYRLSGYSTVDPKTQEVTCVFNKAKKLRSDLEAFTIKHDWSDLEEFRISKPTASRVMQVYNKNMEALASNVTKIHGRVDLHVAVDLVFHSVLEFYIGDEHVKKGWLDCMILGDTRCGKGYVVENLVKYFGVGEVVSAENSSYAGIVAGLEQYNKSWSVRWGKIPMNDRGLCVIDEAGNLHESWEKLSRIRSEGIAEINKIHTHQTNARTRLIFIANPLKSTVNAHTHGVACIQELIKSPEDIARFDFACVVCSSEVNLSVINSHKDSAVEVFSQHLERDLIMWAWSRSVDQVVFTDTAKAKIFQYAIELGNRYDAKIPLIQGENIRIKLARIAVAFAARCYNSIVDGTVLEVSSAFIDCAEQFITDTYAKPGNGYLDFSMNKQTEVGMALDIETIEEYIESWSLKKDIIIMYFNDNPIISAKGMHESLALEPIYVNEIISKMMKNRVLEPVGQTYKKLPHFTQWIKNKYRYLINKQESERNSRHAQKRA